MIPFFKKLLICLLLVPAIIGLCGCGTSGAGPDTDVDVVEDPDQGRDGRRRV